MGLKGCFGYSFRFNPRVRSEILGTRHKQFFGTRVPNDTSALGETASNEKMPLDRVATQDPPIKMISLWHGTYSPDGQLT